MFVKGNKQAVKQLVNLIFHILMEELPESYPKNTLLLTDPIETPP